MRAVGGSFRQLDPAHQMGADPLEVGGGTATRKAPDDLVASGQSADVIATVDKPGELLTQSVSFD